VMPLAAESPVLLFGLLMFWGGMVAGLYTVGLTHLGARLAGTDLASANAAFILMYATGMLVGPALIGAGMDIWNPHGLSAVTAAFMLAYTIFAALRIRRVPRR
jgi:predicted MFS family arabinose efflux permease